MAGWVAVVMGVVVAAAGAMADTVAQWVSGHPTATLVFAGLANIVAAIMKSPLYQASDKQ